MFSVLLLLASISSTVAVPEPCRALSTIFPHLVSNPGTETYNETNSEYWNQGCILKPNCIFYPKKASHVSVALKTLEHFKTPFAIKSGGHMPNPMFNNVDNGILISTERMKEMRWAEGDSVLQVSAGALWSEVYDEIASKDRLVVGGRVGSIGVSGFLLGGGMSHLGAAHGFGCDNVLGMQVVLASGRIVYATPSKYPDLFKALKGGSSNFGFVTRFDLSAYPTGKTWGGNQLTILMDDAARTRALDATAKFHLEGSLDKNAGLIPTFGTIYSMGVQFFVGTYFHSDPPSHNRTPAVFQDFLDFGGVKVDVGFYTLAEVVNVTSEGTKKGVARNTLHARSIIASKESISKVDEIFRAEFAKIADVEGLQIWLTFQPVPKSFIYAGRKNGGNVMGLLSRSAPYSWISQSVSWTNAADDARIEAAQIAAGDAYMAWARLHGFANDFIYLNDADYTQDVFGGYGEDNRDFLREMKDKYDPTSVFTVLMSGGYKV